MKTSPWCFFELLCHLDEEPNFAKAKGNLMKFRGIDIVDKPLDRAVADPANSDESRIWSSDLCYAALAAIDAARSLDDLANSVLVDEAGNNRGPLKDLADRVRGVLDDAERTFQDHMTSMIKVLKREGSNPRSAESNHTVIMSTIVGYGLPLPDTPDLDYSVVDEQLGLKHSYCFWSYFLLQAIALAACGRDTCSLNDLEDGQLCGYISLNEPIWVVAGDKTLRERLAETRKLLDSIGLGDRARFEPSSAHLLLSKEPT